MAVLNKHHYKGKPQPDAVNIMRGSPFGNPFVMGTHGDRADPVALAAFDPSTKTCNMNCGKHALDPRSYKELKFMCDDC